MAEIGPTLPPLVGEVFGYMQSQGIAPAGAPFFRYRMIDMEARLDIEVGWPTAHAVEGRSPIISGALPTGRYAVYVHTGHPTELYDVTAALLDWAKANDIQWQTSADGKEWAGRLEFYLTDPAQEPDMRKWQTELAFLTA
jgi:effector-binding domain-containing protein